jgi:hypothetical protein
LYRRHFLVKTETKYTKLLPINAGVPQGSVLEPLLYLLYTADLPIRPETTIATSADDTGVLASDNDPVVASYKLQTNLTTINNWLKKWRIKANESKSVHVTFTRHTETCPQVHINNV